MEIKSLKQGNAIANQFQLESVQSLAPFKKNVLADSELQDYFPYGINEIIAEIVDASFHQSDYQSEDEEQIKRIKQSNCMFVLVIMASLITAMENLYIFLGEWIYRDLIFVPPTVLFRLIVLPLTTYKMCQNWSVLLRLFFMVDKVLLAAILEYIGVMTFIMIFIPYTPIYLLYYMLIVFYPIIWLLYIGNFRVLIIYCDWSKWQVLAYKMTLLIGSTSYFILGVHYLVGNLRFTKGLAPELDQKIENILLIYINAGFQVYLEMLARMDGIDGISGFRNDYKLQCDPDDMEMLLKGRQKGEQLQSMRKIAQLRSGQSLEISKKSKSLYESSFADDESKAASIMYRINEVDDKMGNERILNHRQMSRIRSKLEQKRSYLQAKQSKRNLQIQTTNAHLRPQIQGPIKTLFYSFGNPQGQ